MTTRFSSRTRSQNPLASLSLLLRRRWTAALLCTAMVVPASLALSPTAADAMTVLRVGLPDLVKTSELVLHAKVVSTRVHDRRAQGLAVFTENTLQIIEVYKGDPKRLGKTFAWEMLGGTAGGLTWSMPGMPTFTAGEEVVVLLEKHAKGYTLTGAPQGKFSVTRDAKGIARVQRRFGDVHFVQRDAKTGRISHTPHAVKPVLLQRPKSARTLMSLRAEIKALVVKQAARKPAVRQVLPRARALPRKTVGKRKP